MNRNKKILIILGILILLTSGIFLDFLFFKPKDLDIFSDEIRELYNSVNPSSDFNVANLLYSTNPLANEYILDIGLMAVIQEVGEENAQTISKEKVEEKIKYILGDISYYHEKTYLLEKVCGYTYNDLQQQYEIINGCGGNWYKRIHRKMISAKKKRNKIIITEKMIYEEDDWNDTLSKRTIYSDLSKTKQLDYKEVSSNINYAVDIEEYLEEASTYEYIFEKKDNHYIFKNISKK